MGSEFFLGCKQVHFCSLFGCHAWDRWVFKDASIKELHDVEVAAYNAFILTECVGFRDWDVGVLEGMDDPVFAIDLVSCLRAVSLLQAFSGSLVP